ncbi:hypothetical protein BJX66DRAFT_13643 [Aspergillus keveii]|uniref:Uncharacterized protein n=1 Tax=Aspergillus keveii TaxID=714993 RepID=A0ABR4GIZ8_9EURO
MGWSGLKATWHDSGVFSISFTSSSCICLVFARHLSAHFVPSFCVSHSVFSVAVDSCMSSTYCLSKPALHLQARQGGTGQNKQRNYIFTVNSRVSSFNYSQLLDIQIIMHPAQKLPNNGTSQKLLPTA